VNGREHEAEADIALEPAVVVLERTGKKVVQSSLTRFAENLPVLPKNSPLDRHGLGRRAILAKCHRLR